MKTIQIPTNKNPYVVIINNKTYTYKAGETVEVPDEVAEAIQDALDLAPKYGRYLSRFAQRADGSIAKITVEDLEGIETIADHSFNYCHKLTDVTVPDSITNIGNGAFYNCVNLEIIRFVGNSKVNSIGKSVFDWCVKLASVYLPETPPMLEDVNAFANIKSTCTFYCKTQASLDAYKSAANWSTLTGTYTFTVES